MRQNVWTSDLKEYLHEEMWQRLRCLIISMEPSELVDGPAKALERWPLKVHTNGGEKGATISTAHQGWRTAKIGAQWSDEADRQFVGNEERGIEEPRTTLVTTMKWPSLVVVRQAGSQSPGAGQA
jgi:hypothetical protein